MENESKTLDNKYYAIDTSDDNIADFLRKNLNGEYNEEYSTVKIEDENYFVAWIKIENFDDLQFFQLIIVTMRNKI